jgi:hypothetical protein
MELISRPHMSSAEAVLPLTFGDIFVQSPMRWCLLHNCEVESLAVMRQLCSTFMRDVPRVINSKDWQLKHRCVILYKESSRKQCTTLYRLDPTFYRQYPSIFLYPSELYPQEVYPQEAVWIAIITATRPTNELASADFDQLVAMGFDASKVAAALSQNRGDREKALNMLLSGASRISWGSDMARPDLLMRQLASGMASSRVYSFIWTNFEVSPDSSRANYDPELQLALALSLSMHVC